MANLDEEDELLEGNKHLCPKCGSRDIRGSQSERVLDSLLKSFSLKPYRCRSCRKRFYLRKPAKPEVDIDDHAVVKHKHADSKVNP
jgi:uncharacterized protein with PIN domain